eukprot:COSAG02_NODE_1165_length_14156_cov_58.567191_5_plen_167_part_00
MDSHVAPSLLLPPDGPPAAPLSLSLAVCPSLCLSVCPSLPPADPPSRCPSLSLCLPLCLCPYRYPFRCPSLLLSGPPLCRCPSDSVRLAVWLSGCLSVCLSGWLAGWLAVWLAVFTQLSRQSIVWGGAVIVAAVVVSRPLRFRPSILTSICVPVCRSLSSHGWWWI